jgi:hypothetical protein
MVGHIEKVGHLIEQQAPGQFPIPDREPSTVGAELQTANVPDRVASEDLIRATS